jgi:hypothetical protein
MTLAAGAVLGNYLIRERLGSGAMGEIYRAQTGAWAATWRSSS